MVTAEAAAITVRVFFYGLIAFVPNNNTVTVVVPDETANMHTAFVWYNGQCSNYKTDSCDQTVTVPSIGKIYGVALKNAAKIQLSGVTGTTPSVALSPGAVGVLPNGANELSFQWVPAFASFHSPADSQIAADCLTSQRCGRSAEIAGRMTLTAGTLYACTHRRYKDGGIHSIFFKDTSGNTDKKLEQAIAEIVWLQPPASNGSVTLQVGDNFGVVLTPKDGEVDIVVANLPPATSDGYSDTKGVHFALLHKLLANKTSTDVNLNAADSVDIVEKCAPSLLIPKGFLVDRTLRDPASRPICPMAILSPP